MTFNAGSSPLDFITETGIKNTDNNVSTHYYIPGDVVGASKALLGSSKDKLVQVQPKRWLVDVAKTFKSAALGSLFGPFGTVIGAGIGIKNSILDLHDILNFLPDETFKNKLDKDDIMYKYIKPMDVMLQQAGNRRNIPTDFTAPIMKADSLNVYKPVIRPTDYRTVINRTNQFLQPYSPVRVLMLWSLYVHLLGLTEFVRI